MQTKEGEKKRIKRSCNIECISKAQEYTSATRAFGMADFKSQLPPAMSNHVKVETHYNENYFLSKPDIWIHNILKTDDIIILGNSTVFQQMPVSEMVGPRDPSSPASRANSQSEAVPPNSRRSSALRSSRGCRRTRHRRS